MSSVEILNRIPNAGQYKEINFGNSNDLLWTLVTDDRFEEWIAKFDLGHGRKNKITMFDENMVYILASGKIYKFNIKEKKVEQVFENDYWDDFAISSKYNRMITTDGFVIYVFDLNGKEIFKTMRVSVDGFDFIEIDDNCIMGKYDDFSKEWGDFRYNFMENKIECNWIFDENI